MEITRKFNTGQIKFTFTNERDEIFAWFYMNPTDVNLLARSEEVAQYFAERKQEAPVNAGGEELKAFNKEIEEKINYLLGYDASKDLFGTITATTISPEGEIFAYVVLDFIADIIGPELEKRAEKMQKNISRYTDKYES